mmetsp:Transcript_2430/g.6103  ORF Transcript_2430/g.6103 Transcript_2430/m.6103 type:complete len:212 (+) Transcript_2430:940-1575(+)
MVFLCGQTVQDRLRDKHRYEAHREEDTGKGLPLEQVGGEAETPHMDKILASYILHRLPDVGHYQQGHCASIGEAPEREDSCPNVGAVVVVVSTILTASAIQYGLGEHEDHQREKKPGLPKQEDWEGNSAPNKVRHQCDGRVAHEFRVSAVGQPLEGLCELALRAEEQRSHKVDHPALAILREASTPDKAIEKRWQESWSIDSQPFDDVRVP